MSLNSASVRRSSGSNLSSFPQYQSLAETYGCSIVHKSFLSDHFARSSGLYHRDLLGHYGCVNAIEFSSNGGEFIVSGVDHLLFICVLLFLCFGPLIRGTSKNWAIPLPRGREGGGLQQLFLRGKPSFYFSERGYVSAL